MNIRQRIASLLIYSVIGLQLTGCALDPLRTPRASPSNGSKLSYANLAPASLGPFKLGARLDPQIDTVMTLRAGFVAPPSGGSFSQYLAETLKVELDAVGLYDPKAQTAIAGMLMRNEVDISPFSPGRAVLSAHFIVNRAGVTRFDRELTVDATWDNAFAGAVAIPVARSQYEVMYRKLVGALFDDPEFRSAMSKE